MYRGRHLNTAAAYSSVLAAEVGWKLRRERDERGATMTEYGLLLGFIAVIVFGGLALFGPAVVDLFSDTEDEFSSRRNAGP